MNNYPSCKISRMQIQTVSMRDSRDVYRNNTVQILQALLSSFVNLEAAKDPLHV